MINSQSLSENSSRTSRVLNTVWSFVTSIGLLLIHGLKTYFFGPSKLWGTAVHRRFLKVPRLIASVGKVALVITYSFYVLVNSSNTFFSGAIFPFLVMIGMMISDAACSCFCGMMMRARFWNWCGHKFDGRQEFKDWILLTPSGTIEQAARLQDHQWEPRFDNLGRPGIEIYTCEGKN